MKMPEKLQINRLSKILMVGIAFLAIVLLCLVAIYLTRSDKVTETDLRIIPRIPSPTTPSPTIPTVPTPEPKPEFCLNQGCMKTAAMLLESMDSSVNPCDDFYDYACRRYPRPRQRTAVSEVNVDIFIKAMVEGPKLDSELSVFHKIKDLYARCMDTDAVYSEGAFILLTLLPYMTGMPDYSSKTWQPSADYAFEQLVVELQQQGLPADAFFTVNVVPNPTDLQSHIIQIGPAEFEIPHVLKNDSELKSDPRIRAYMKLRKNVKIQMGADRVHTSTYTNSFTKYESMLKDGTRKSTDGVTPTILTMAELDKAVPLTISWALFLTGMIYPDGFNISVTTPAFPDTQPVLMNLNPTILGKMISYIMANESAPYTTAYMVWKSILPFCKTMGSDIEFTWYEYETSKPGVTPPPRWKHCISHLKQYFPIGVANMYAKRVFDERLVPFIQLMVDTLKTEIKEIVSKSDWMAEVVRERALTKIDLMVFTIGFPPEIDNEIVVDNYYRNVTIEFPRFLEVLLGLGNFKISSNSIKLMQRRNGIAVDESPTVIGTDVVYNAKLNRIEVPAGMMQKAMFDPWRPYYANFAYLGHRIARKIMTALYAEGASYNEKGILSTWWAPETYQNFYQRTACLQKQYQVTQTQILMTDFVADIGGIHGAYRAYIAWMTQQKPDMPIFRVIEDAKQLFWLSYASSQCTMDTPVSQYEYKAAKLRVNSALANLPEFSRDFNCPLESPMNPGTKCTIW